MFRPILAALVSAFAMFSLAGLFTGVLARSFIASNVDPTLLRPTPNLPLIFLGYLLLATVMTVLYRRVALPVASPALAGFKMGLLTAVAWLMPYSLVLFGVYRFPYSALPLDFAWAFVEQGVGGLLIGLILGHGRRNA
jgi:hypothetical protein